MSKPKMKFPNLLDEYPHLKTYQQALKYENDRVTGIILWARIRLASAQKELPSIKKELKIWSR